MDYHLKVNMSQMYFGDKKTMKMNLREVEAIKMGINVPFDHERHCR